MLIACSSQRFGRLAAALAVTSAAEEPAAAPDSLPRILSEARQHLLRYSVQSHSRPSPTPGSQSRSAGTAHFSFAQLAFIQNLARSMHTYGRNLNMQSLQFKPARHQNSIQCAIAIQEAIKVQDYFWVAMGASAAYLHTAESHRPGRCYILPRRNTLEQLHAAGCDGADS